MPTSTLPITTIVTISIEQANAGLSVPQVNNLCLLTTEVPINSVPAIGYFIYQNSTQVATDWGSNSETFAQARNVFAQRPNILSGEGQLVVYQMVSPVVTLTEAIVAVEKLIFCGAYIWAGYAPNNTEIEAAAAEAESVNKMLGVSSYLVADLSGSGLFATLAGESISAPVMLLYTQTASALGAREAMAAFLGRGMSTDFGGSDTTSTMNLKTLANILGDSGITPTIQNTCATLGVNTYPNIQNQPYVISSGGADANFFDTVYNSEWFGNACQVAYFNALATTNTKIPQTEQGMSTIRAALIGVCQQAVNNGFLAPGTWNGEIPFGDPETFEKNIQQNGYYVYTAPVATQSQAARAARSAPIAQIGGKETGAVHNGNILVFFQP